MPEQRDLNLYFDDQERAERVILAIHQIMGEDNMKRVTFGYHKEIMFDSDQDILDALNTMPSTNLKEEDLKQSAKNQPADFDNDIIFEALKKVLGPNKNLTDWAMKNKN